MLLPHGGVKASAGMSVDRQSRWSFLVALLLVAAGTACVADQSRAIDGALIGITLGAPPVGEASVSPDSMSATANEDVEGEDAEPPPSWDRLDDLVGGWRCSTWGFAADGARVRATSTWTASRVDATTVRLLLQDFLVDGFDGQLDNELLGHCDLSYDPTDGYRLVCAFSSTSGEQRWVGMRRGSEERYQFRYAGPPTDGAGVGAAEVAIELRFLRRGLFILETFTLVGGEQVQTQSYRFARAS